MFESAQGDCSKMIRTNKSGDYFAAHHRRYSISRICGYGTRARAGTIRGRPEIRIREYMQASTIRLAFFACRD